ncbi:MAG: signal peptidase I [Eubacterium sp.]|nr:signal peptidase I [Eubacterium sp.]
MSRGLSFKRRRRSIDKGKALYVTIWVAEILGVILAAYLIVAAFGFRTSMVGDAMYPTLSDSDVVLVNRLKYKLLSPSRGDVVAFRPDSNTKSHYYIRRIVGIPGDTVLVSDGELYVNDEIVSLAGLTGQILVAGNASEPITLEDGEYFVIGDNPNSSEDSRHGSVGIVTMSDIEGKVYMAVSIGSHLGFIR